MTQTAPQTDTQHDVVTGRWDADVAHSSLDFVARYLMATKVRGAFAEWNATLFTGATAQESRAEVHIQAASITTNNAQRDGHLKSADFFEPEKYPTIDFVSTEIVPAGGDHRFAVTGDLTMHGVTKPVTLDVEWVGNVTKDLYGNTRSTFSGSAEIDREEWGLTWNAALETGGVLVSKKVKIEVEVQFILRTDEA